MNAVELSLADFLADDLERLGLPCDMPSEESMGGLALAIAAGGALKASKTTALMTGAQGVEALKKAANVAKGYKPAK